MKVASGCFTVQGAPSGDGYGGAFEYTNPAPLVASVPADRWSSIFAIDISPLCIAFCVVMNIAALMMVLPRAW